MRELRHMNIEESFILELGQLRVKLGLKVKKTVDKVVMEECRNKKHSNQTKATNREVWVRVHPTRFIHHTILMSRAIKMLKMIKIKNRQPAIGVVNRKQAFHHIKMGPTTRLQVHQNLLGSNQSQVNLTVAALTKPLILSSHPANLHQPKIK